MSGKTRQAHDVFTFSLGGLRTIAGYTPAAVVADTCFRQESPGRDGRGSGTQRPAGFALDRETEQTGCCSAA